MHAPDLERELRDLAPALDWPAAPNLAPAVRARIAGARRPFPWRRTAVIAFAVLVVAVGAVMAVPGTRAAILDWLGLQGATIHRVETLPTAPTVTDVDELGLGRNVTLDEAQSLARYPVPDPTATGLGEPDEIRFDAHGIDQVSFIWRDDDGKIGTLFSVFEGRVDQQFIEKWVNSGVPLEAVTVDGHRGVWIGGSLEHRPHTFVYRQPNGEFREETMRLAGSTLLWEQDGRLYRLEGDRSKAEALRIAESVAQEG